MDQKQQPDTQPSTSVTIDLEYPVTVHGETLTALTLRRPTVGDMLKTRGKGMSDEEFEVALVAKLAGRNPEDLHGLDALDWGRVQDVLTGFLRRPAPRTA